MPILDHALAWAARGFRIFPILPGNKVPPKDMQWKSEATTDPEKIRAWWAFEPNYNYAVAGGDGLMIVDIDANKNGYASLMEVDVPSTLAVKTPGGGMHLYLKSPDVATSVERIAPGIDIRAVGGYVVGPGSYFSDPGNAKGYTGSYEIVTDVAMAEAPTELVLKAGEPRTKQQGGALSEDNEGDIAYATHYLQKDAPVAISGQGGNDTSYKVAAFLADLGLSEGTIADLLLEHWNERCLPPWTADEVKRFATNASSYAQNRVGTKSLTQQALDGGSAADILPPDPAPTSVGKFANIFSQGKLTPLEDIPPRQWVMHRLLLRNEVTVAAGPGGVGKSGLSLAVAAHGAVGRDFETFKVVKPFKSIIYNAEDSRHEMEARLYATCASYNLPVDEVAAAIRLWPGQEMRFRLFSKDHKPCVADVVEFAREAVAFGADMIALDPLVSLHYEKEEDNVAMGEVMECAHILVRRARCAGLILHHTPKGTRAVGSAEAVRGAGNIVNAVRIATTIYAADEADAALYGLGKDYRAKYIRVDDAKQNNAAMHTKPLWLEKVNFPMPNGDSSYSLRVVEHGTTAKGEADLIAVLIAKHMAEYGQIQMTTYDAAKVLVAADAYFQEKQGSGGDLRHIKGLVELRLAAGVKLDTGEQVRIEVKTEPNGTTRPWVVLVASPVDAQGWEDPPLP